MNILQTFFSFFSLHLQMMILSEQICHGKICIGLTVHTIDIYDSTHRHSQQGGFTSPCTYGTTWGGAGPGELFPASFLL